MATERASLIGFLATGVAFVAAATFLVMPSLLGAAYFVIAALLTVFSGIAWAYAAGKHQLLFVLH